MERKGFFVLAVGVFVLISPSMLHLTFTFAQVQPTQQPFRTIAVDQALLLNASVSIVDIRGADAYAQGHLKDAENIPFADCSPCFISRLDPFKTQSLLLYDAHGEFSANAASYLASRGFTAVSVLSGGMDAWVADSQPIVVDEAADCHCSLPGAKDYGTGLLHGPTPLPAGMVLTDPTPSTWDWRNAVVDGVSGDWTTPIRNQGQCGSCYAFARLGALEASMKIASKSPTTAVDLSEQFIVSCGTEWAGDGIFGCDGGYFDTTCNFIKTYGSIPETCFPYTSGGGSVPPCSEKCSNWPSLVSRIDDWHMVASDTTSLKNAMVAHGPLTVTMTVYDDFYGYSGGVYEHPGSDPDPTNHMVVIVGYNDNEQCWICKNQWGTGWGEDGYFRITYGDCNIGENAAYFDVTAVSLTVTMHRIKMIGEIEGWLEGDADWSYRIQVNNGHEWVEQVNDDYSDNEDDHTEDVVHSFGIYAPSVEITIKVWDRDFLSGDDLADVSGYVGGGADDDTTDLRGAIFHGTYDVATNHFTSSDTIEMDGSYFTTSGTYPPDGGQDSDAQNDATVWFSVSDSYTPPAPDLQVSGSLGANGSAGATHVYLGSFAVQNIGVDPLGFADSYLDWGIASVPDWGSNWQFEPDGGTNLPSGHSTTVGVYVDVPSQRGSYSGQVKVWNLENHADYGLVPISLTAPVDEVAGGVVLRQLLFPAWFLVLFPSGSGTSC